MEIRGRPYLCGVPSEFLPCAAVVLTELRNLRPTSDMINEENVKRLAYVEALRTLPELSDAIKAVYVKAQAENLSFEDAAKAIGTDDAVRAACHLRRFLTHSTLLPSYYEALIEKVYTDWGFDNDNEDYIDE